MVSVASGCEHGWVARPVLSAILPEGLGGEVGGAYGWRCPEPQALNPLLTGFLGKWVGLHTSTFPLL